MARKRKEKSWSEKLNQAGYGSSNNLSQNQRSLTKEGKAKAKSNKSKSGEKVKSAYKNTNINPYSPLSSVSSGSASARAATTGSNKRNAEKNKVYTSHVTDRFKNKVNTTHSNINTKDININPYGKFTKDNTTNNYRVNVPKKDNKENKNKNENNTVSSETIEEIAKNAKNNPYGKFTKENTTENTANIEENKKLTDNVNKGPKAPISKAVKQIREENERPRDILNPYNYSTSVNTKGTINEISKAGITNTEEVKKAKEARADALVFKSSEEKQKEVQTQINKTGVKVDYKPSEKVLNLYRSGKEKEAEALMQKEYSKIYSKKLADIAKKGKAIKSDGSNAGAYYDKNPVTAILKSGGKQSQAFNAMSEDEKNMAYAVLATQGRDAAAKYLENYRSTAVNEKAVKDFKEFQSGDPNAFDYAVKAVKGGFNRAMEGTAQMASKMGGNDNILDSGASVMESNFYNQYLNGLVDENGNVIKYDTDKKGNLTEKGKEELEKNKNKVGAFAYAAAENIGSMVPTIAMGMAGGGTIGLGTMFTSAYGNSYKDQIGNGVDVDTADKYATRDALSEVLTEKFLGGLPIVGNAGGSFSKHILKGLGKVSSNLAENKVIRELIKGTIDEGMEEWIQAGVLSPLNDRFTLGDKNAKIDLLSPEALESALLGSVVGGIFGTVGSTRVIKTRNSVETSVNDLVNNTQNSPNINGITNAKELADNIKLSGIEESIGAKEGTFSELYTKKELGDIFGKENASEYMSEIDSIKDISAPEKVKNKISEYRQAIRDVRAYKESKANNNQSDISPNNNSIVKRDVSEYTKEDTMKRLIQYENSADVNFNGYISEVMNGRVQNSSYRVSPSSQDIRNDIKSLTGIDTGNAEFTMRPSFLKEIVNADNGIENSDITKLNYILNDYDSIERGDNPSYRVTPLVIKKTVGDSVYTAEVIPDNTAGSKGLSVVNLSKEVRETKPVLERENLTAEESIETLEKQGEVDNKELLKVIKAQQKQIEDLNRKLSGETERENKSSKSILKTRGIKKLSEHIANNLKSGKDNLILGYGTTFKNFIQNAVNNKSYNKRLYAGQVSEELAGEINRLYPEHDVRGYIFTIHSRRIIHILNKHGINNANIDEIPVTQKDLLLILEILNKPEGLRKSNYKDASNRDVIFLEKNIGNNARVVMGISKGKKALDLDTFYIVDKQKRKGRHTPNTTKKSSPSNHVRNGMVTPSNDIISQEGGFVNKTKNEKSNYSIQRDNKGSEYVREVKDENGKTTEIIRRDSEKITDSEIEKIKAEYENAADNVVVKFVDKVLKNRKCKFVRYTSKNILNENLRKDIGVLTDNNIDEDYRADWGSSNVIHVYNRHGKNGIADQTMSDIRDISKAEYVLNNYDYIQNTGAYSERYLSRKNEPSKILLVSKRINGYHHVAFVAPDSKWKKIHILSTYKSKSRYIQENQIKEELSSYAWSKPKKVKIGHTADSSPIDNSISQNGEIDTKKNKEPKYSIQRDNRGSEYVRIDTDQDIFEGVKEKDYPRVARKYMQDYLKGELSLNDNDKITINTRGREKYTNPKQGGDYKSEKMRLTPELKNVLKIAEKISEGIPTKENSKYKKWEYYGFKFEIDGKKFKGKINVGIDKGGKKFYDINGISPVGEAAAIATFEANRGHSINNIISQNEKNDTKKNKNSINDNNKEIRQQKGYDEELFSEKGQEFNEENAEKYKVPIDYIDSINEISKNVGVEVRFRRLQAKDNGNVIEGMYKNGVIYLDPESKIKINTIFKHELTHYLKNGSKGEYERLEKFVLRTIYSNTEAREALENRINLYMKEVEGFSREDAKEEVLSDFVSEYLFTDKENDMVVRLAREETSLFTRIRDFFKMLKNTFIKYKGSKKARTAGKIQNRIIKAEQMYKRIYDNVVKNGVDTDTGEHVKYHVSRNFESEINKVLDNDLNDNVMIKARDVTPKVLINAGAKNLPMLLAQSHVKQIVYTKEQGEALGLNYDYYHGLGIEGLLEAIDNLDNPTRLFQYTNDKKHFIFETTARDYKGRLVVVPIRLEENGSYNEISIDNNGLEITKNKIIKNNQVKTAFGTDIKKYIDKKVEKGILVEIKKTTSSNSESEGNNPKDYETDKSSSKDIIPQNKKNDTEKHKLSYANEALTEEIPNSFEIAKSRAGKVTEIIRRDSEKITDSEIKKIKAEYEKSVDEGLLRFIKKIKNNKELLHKKANYKIAEVKDILVKDIKTLTGLNVKGYTHSIDITGVEHLENSHGEFGSSNQSLADDIDKARIQYILENYDSIKIGKRKSTRFYNSDLTRANTVVFSKRINGFYEVVEAIPDTKNRLLRITTGYKIKNKEDVNSRHYNAKNSLTHTSETSFGFNSTSSKDIIPQKKKNDTEKHKLSYANEALSEEIPNSFEIAKSRAGKVTFKKLPLKQDLENLATKQSVLGADKLLSKQKGAKHQIAALKQNLINDGYAVEKLGKSLRNERMKYYYNTVLHSGKTAEFNVGKYQVDYKGKKVGKSLREIFEPIRDSSDFTFYMLHRLNIDRWKTNKPIDPKTSREKSEMMIKRYEASHPEYIKAAKEIYKYISNTMQYKVDNGLIDKATKDYLEELYPNYIPVEQIDPYGFRGTKTRHRLSINKPIKEAEGFSGFENITDIDKALVRMTMGTTKNAKINMLLSEFYKEAKKGLTKGEVDIRKVEDISIEDLSDMYDDNLTVLDPGEVVFYDNGKKVTLGVNNPMLFESLTRLNSYKNSSVFDNIFADGLNTAMNIFKKSVTAWDPTFAIRNFFKDIGDALLYAPDFKAFVKQYPTAVKEIVKGIWGGGSELWDLYQSQGGLQETYWGDDSFNIKDRKGIKAGLKVFDLVEQANVLIEQAPRFTEFIDQVRKGGTSYENLTKAMYRADDITVNFNRGGKVVKIANRYFVPFFNPAVQGGDKLIRSLLEQPNGKALAGFMFKGISLGISVMAMNGLIKFIQDRDEDEEEKKKRDKAYSQLNDYVKNSYYLFYMGDGKYLRIPKGRAVSAIGILTNDIYRKAAKGEDVSFLSSEGTFGQMWEQISPLPSGTLISPITDAMNNKNYYGGQLVSDSMQKRKPSEQYDENTDVISKKIGQITNISPKKINYVLKQYSGVGGRLLLPFATPSGLVGKDNAVEGTFKNLTKSFISDTAYSNNISSKYYDVLNDLDQRISAEYDKGNKTYTPAKVVKWYVSNVSEDLNALYGKKKAVLEEDLTNAEKVMKQRKIQLKINKLQEESTQNILKVEEELNKIYKKKVKKDKEARLYSTDLAKALYKTVGGEKGGKEAIRVLNYKDDEATKHSVKMKKSGVSYKKQAKYYIYYNDIKYKKSKYTGWKKEQLIKKAKTLDIPVSAQMMLIYSTATGFGSNYSIRNEFGYGRDESRNKVYNYLIENKSLSKKEKIKMFEYMGYEVVKENGKYYACW